MKFFNLDCKIKFYYVNFIMLILSSPLFLKAETNSSKIDILSKKINDLEEKLIKIGHPKKAEYKIKAGDIFVNDVKFGRVSIINNDDYLKKITADSNIIDFASTVLLFNEDNSKLIPVSTTLLDFNGRKVIGENNYITIDQNLNSVIKDKVIKCADDLVIPTNGLIISDSLELKIKSNSNNKSKFESRKKIKFYFCAKPILDNGENVLGVYLVHINKDSIQISIDGKKFDGMQ